jgi:hypothetical protein
MFGVLGFTGNKVIQRSFAKKIVLALVTLAEAAIQVMIVIVGLVVAATMTEVVKTTTAVIAGVHPHVIVSLDMKWEKVHRHLALNAYHATPVSDCGISRAESD